VVPVSFLPEGDPEAEEYDGAEKVSDIVDVVLQEVLTSGTKQQLNATYRRHERDISMLDPEAKSRITDAFTKRKEQLN
jgi:hypothetical protein